MDAERQALKAEIQATYDGPFAGWWERLLEAAPESLRRVHHMLGAIHAGSTSTPAFRHLVWVAVDSLVTHLYMRGAGIHARVAMEHGASPRQVIETLEIATAASTRGFARALPVALAAIEQAGLAAPLQQISHYQACIAAFGTAWPASPRDADDPGLDAKSRALLHLACAASPALADTEAVRTHAQAALHHGATPAELVEVLQLANCIGTHALADGVMVLEDGKA